MFQKLLHFIKYHNAFNLILLAIFLVTASTFAASPEVRQGVADTFVSKTETVKSVDNRRLVTSDLNTLNPQLQVISISDDNDNYYAVYRYNTLSIQNYVWSEATEEKTLKIAKAQLGPHDLGLYIATKLGDVVSYELEYLKRAQALEKQNGETQKVATVAYSGLIGKFLDPEEKIFPGYEPVVKVVKPVPDPSLELPVPAVSAPAPNPAPTLVLVPVPQAPPTPAPTISSTVSVVDLGKTPIPAQGITIYDRVTNQPKCLFVYNGGIGIADGLCNEGKDTNTNTPVAAPIETPVSNPTPPEVETPISPAIETSPVDISTPNVEPTATATPEVTISTEPILTPVVEQSSLQGLASTEPTVATSTPIIETNSEPVIVSTTTVETATTTP